MIIIRKLMLFICALFFIPMVPLAFIIWSFLDLFHEDKVTSEMFRDWFNCLLWRA